MRLLLLSLVTAFIALARQPFDPSDLWLWRYPDGPQIAPDGQTIVYWEGWNAPSLDRTLSNLWIASADGKSVRRLTEGNWSDTCPRWSPDSTRIAWISTRDGQPHIRVRTLEPGPETTISTGYPPRLIAWAPDGASIAFTALVPATSGAAPWAPPAILPHLVPPRPGTVHIFVVPVSGGKPRQITTGDSDILGEPAWMPDSRSILAARDDGQIYAFHLSGEVRQVTHDPGSNTNPLPSPDGSRIAWLATRPPLRSYAPAHLTVMNADGSRIRVLSGSLDRDPASPKWSSDSRTVYFLADDHGVTHVYAARNDGTLRQVTNNPERLEGLSLADNGRAVALRSTATQARAVYTFTVDHVTQPVTLADPNDRMLAERDLATTTEIHFDSAGQSIQGWILQPPHFDPARKYPLLLDIRDDPRSMYGVDFNLRAQILAARGWIVLCINPRGTPGYGEQFGDLLPTRYPGDDYDDLMHGVNAVLAAGHADPQRLVVAGGLVAAWTIGHTTRFRAAVVRRPISDWVTDVATSSEGAHRAAAWMRAMPWDDPDQYVKHSPLYFAKNFQTPTLVLSADPDPESDELYFALQQRKIASALVRFPAAEPPSNQILELQATIAWFEKNLAAH